MRGATVVQVERRASTLLLAGIPESQCKDLVRAKKLIAMRTMFTLLATYQPGGLADSSSLQLQLKLMGTGARSTQTRRS